jgi:hypothetical protein
MKETLSEESMLLLLELAKDAEQKARASSELATSLALKYQQKMRKFRSQNAEKAS